MRKITEQAVDAFNNDQPFKKGNTSVEVAPTTTFMKLHGNTIAIRHSNGLTQIQTCGWISDTTKERLNGLRGVSIVQRNFKWYLNGNLWNGSLINVDHNINKAS